MIIDGSGMCIHLYNVPMIDMEEDELLYFDRKRDHSIQNPSLAKGGAGGFLSAAGNKSPFAKRGLSLAGNPKTGKGFSSILDTPDLNVRDYYDMDNSKVKISFPKWPSG